VIGRNGLLVNRIFNLPHTTGKRLKSLMSNPAPYSLDTSFKTQVVLLARLLANLTGILEVQYSTQVSLSFQCPELCSAAFTLRAKV
jgi:hypothetical protein